MLSRNRKLFFLHFSSKPLDDLDDPRYPDTPISRTHQLTPGNKYETQIWTVRTLSKVITSTDESGCIL